MSNNKKIYIRFGLIPEDEISQVWDGDNGAIRKECGVSVYDCIDYGYCYKLVLPSVHEGALHTLQGLLFYDSDKKILLVTGDLVGFGSDGEPCIKNVSIIKHLKVKELHDPEPEFKLDRSNTQLVFV